MESFDNTAGATNPVFTIQFDTLVTGVKGNLTTVKHYTNNAVIEAAKNTAYVGWYDKAGGYNNTGHAYGGGIETTRINRRSGGANFSVNIRQPYLTLQKAAAKSAVGANDVISYTLLVANTGNDVAYDITLKDVLPAGLLLLGVDAVQVHYASGFSVPAEPEQTHVTPATIPGATLAYAIDRLYTGSSVAIVYRAQVADNVSADLTLTNTASIPQYSSKPGAAPDTNGDKLADERTYAGPTATAAVRTPAGSIQKTVEADELTYGSTLVYRILVPAQPINATLYNVVVTDTIDSTLQIVNVQNGAANGNRVQATFPALAPMQQEVVIVTAALPAGSLTAPGTLVRNTAYVSYTNGGVKQSNEIDKTAAQVDVQPGVLVDYTITVRNVGNGRAEAVQVADALPTGFSFQGGTAQLNGKPLADLSGNGWSLPTLIGGARHVITFQARADEAVAGRLYTNIAAVHANDSRGQAIPADNSARVPADTDAGDTAKALVYGPLTWQDASTYVAFEDLKNVG